MIYTPHKDAQDRVAGPEHLHLLLDEVFLFGLGFGGQHEHGARGAAGVTESRHHSPLLSPSLSFCSPLQLSLKSPERANTRTQIQIFLFYFNLSNIPLN